MTESKPNPSPNPIIIRPAHLWEGKRIGEIAAKTYRDTPLTKFLSPYRDQYYSDYERGFQYRAQTRMLKANSQTFVACEASNPNFAIGFAQFGRLGDDVGYKAQMKKRDTYWLRLFALMFYCWTKLNMLVWEDRSRFEGGEALFVKYSADEERLHWSSPERKNRWEAMSVVVLEEYQGKGIGKMLMKKVIDMAEEEGVYVGLHASEHGAFLYRSVGFELLAPFQNLVHEDDTGGGIMMYTPSSLRKEKSV